MIDRLSGRVALLIVVIATLAVVLLGWFVLVSPERAKASKLDGQIADTNTQLQAVTNLLEGPVGRQSLVSLRLFQKAVPDDPRVSQILRQLSAYAQAAGVELDTISPGALVPGAGTETLPLSLSVKGQYFGLQKFLKLLRTSADLAGDQVRATGRLYTVDSIQFSGGGGAPAPGEASAGAGAVSASFSANAFVYAPTAVAPTVAPPTTTNGTSTGTTTTP